MLVVLKVPLTPFVVIPKGLKPPIHAPAPLPIHK